MVFSSLSVKELTDAINEMVASVGVSENQPLDKLIELLHRGEVQEATERVAKILRLPVKIALSFVPEDYNSEAPASFRTSALVTTGCDGRGFSGIVAQVAIPRNLPMYGTPALAGFPVQIRVGEKAHRQPYTFIAIMAHELSHIVLHSLIHPQRHSEIHTDLIPLLLGFRAVVAQGRKVVVTEHQGDSIRTTTTTHGYLTDEQFRIASQRLEKIVANRRAYVRRLRERVMTLQQSTAALEREIKRYKLYRERLAHPPDQEEAWEAAIKSYRDLGDSGLSIVETTKHYNKPGMDRIIRLTETIDAALSDARRVHGAVDHSVRELAPSVGVWWKIWIAIRVVFWSSGTTAQASGR